MSGRMKYESFSCPRLWTWDAGCREHVDRYKTLRRLGATAKIEELEAVPLTRPQFLHSFARWGMLLPILLLFTKRTSSRTILCKQSAAARGGTLLLGTEDNFALRG